MQTIIGIDPGLNGGLAFIGLNKLVVQKMPSVKVGKKSQINISELCEWAAIWRPLKPVAYVESVHAMPGQGVTSMFNFGMGYGIIQGVLTAHGIPIVLVTPQAWQKVMLAGMQKDGKGSKGCGYQVASRLWSGQSFLESSRCRKPHSGMVDAALIAEYGRRTHGK